LKLVFGYFYNPLFFFLFKTSDPSRQVTYFLVFLSYCFVWRSGFCKSRCRGVLFESFYLRLKRLIKTLQVLDSSLWSLNFVLLVCKSSLCLFFLSLKLLHLSYLCIDFLFQIFILLRAQ
jgi:hypothetical protein